MDKGSTELHEDQLSWSDWAGLITDMARGSLPVIFYIVFNIYIIYALSVLDDHGRYVGQLDHVHNK